MSLWDNVKKFAQPYADDDYDDYDEDDYLDDDYDEPVEKPRREKRRAAPAPAPVSMPAMEDDHQLDLWLEVTLSSGNPLRVNGGSWYSSNGQLQLVVG